MGFIRKLLKLKIYMRTGGPKMTLKVANVESKSVSIELSEVTGDLALVKFHLLQGCLPATNSNYLGIWPAVEAVKGAAIPWDLSLIHIFRLLSQHSSGKGRIVRFWRY